MWAGLAASFLGGGGGGAGGSTTSAARGDSAASAKLGLDFDSSNWTIATGGSSAQGQRPAGAPSDSALYIGAGLAALALLLWAVKR